MMVLGIEFPQQPIFYRLYYDDSGRPLFYSMEDLPGNYVEITQEFYTRSPGNVRVIDGRIVELTWRTAIKLRPGDQGTCCDMRDVCMIVDERKPHVKWSKHGYQTS